MTLPRSSILPIVWAVFGPLAGESAGPQEVLRSQREAVLALAPFRIQCESGYFGDDGNPSPAVIRVELIAGRDGRFTVHGFRLKRAEQPDQRHFHSAELISSMAWDGNGLYFKGGSGDGARFFPRGAFSHVLGDPIDSLVLREVPYFDLFDGFSLRREPIISYKLTIPVGPLQIFEYLGSLDRFCAAQLGRLDLRWCDVVSEPLFAANVRALSVIEDDGNPTDRRVRFTGIPEYPVRRSAVIDLQWIVREDRVGDQNLFRIHKRVSANPVQVVALDMVGEPGAAPSDRGKLDLPEGPGTEVLTFEYSRDIAGGALPSLTTQWLFSSSRIGADGQTIEALPGMLRPVKWWRITAFESLSDAEGRGVIDEYAMMQPHLVDITTFPRWKAFVQAVANPDSQPSD